MTQPCNRPCRTGNTDEAKAIPRRILGRWPAEDAVGTETDWLGVATLRVVSGAFGKLRFLRASRFVSGFRVRKRGTQQPTRGGVVGDAGTDSGQIGIADPVALKSSFDTVCGDDVDRALNLLAKGIKSRVGIFRPKRGGAGCLVYLPSGFGDGGGPVVQLLQDGECVGLEHEMIPT